MSSIISGQVGDEGYHSNVNNLNCGSNELRSNIECALEVLCAKRSEFYDSSSEKGFEKDSGSVKSWDDVFEAVERFSHNTFTLLSWIEEFREVQDIKYDDSRNNRPSVSEWSESILKHVDRIYEEICEDGGRLLNDFAVEKATIRSVLKNVKLEYEIISPGWCEASREEQEEEGGELKCKGGGGGERTAAAENEKLDYENFDPPMSSTLVYDDDLLTLKDRSKYVSQDAHRVRLWWKLVCERENSLAWMQSIQRKIDIIASYYPTHTLRPLYQKYLTDVRARSDFRCALHSISDVITDLFPELRYKAKTLVYDAEEVYEVLERSIRKKLVDLEPEPSQTTLPHTRHVFRPYSPDYRLRPNSEYNLPPPLDDDSSSRLYKTPQRTADSKWSMSGIDELPVYQKPPPPVDSNSSDNQMSDFSFNQIRDRLHLEKDSALIKEPETLDEKMTGGQKDEDKDAVAGADAVENEKENSTTDEDAGEKLEMMTNPIEITEEALRLHSWMKLNENEAIESFNSKPIGWDPSVLGKFLSKNKLMQDDLKRGVKELDRFEVSSLRYLATCSTEGRRVKIIDDSNLQWALLMLKQRHSTLSLFCLDVQCLLERRLDVTQLLDKKMPMEQLRHPTENIWNELSVEMNSFQDNTDADYQLLVEGANAGPDKEKGNSVSSSSSASSCSSG